MGRKFYIFLLMIFLYGCSSEFEGLENDDQLFMKFYGGAGEDNGSAMIALDGGFALVGTTTSFGDGDSDLFLVITDENGNALTSKALGGKGNQSGNGLIQYNNNLLAVGHQEDSTGNSDIWILEMDRQGDSLRSWTFGSPEIDEFGIDIKSISNGNLVVTATRYTTSTNPDTYVLKFDNQMEVIWENKNALNDLSDHFGKNIIEYRDEELVYCSTSKRSYSGYTDMRLTAINSIGEVSWNVYFGENQSVEEAHALTSHVGSFYLIGNTTVAGSHDSDILIVKTNEAGTGARSMTIGFPGASETGKRLVSLRDGSLLVVGERKLQNSNFKDIYIEKIDTEGNRLWEVPYFLSGSQDDLAADALEMENGDLVICGTVSFSGNPMMLLLKMNKEGKLIR